MRIKMLLLKTCVNKVHWWIKKPWEYHRKHPRHWVRKHCVSTLPYTRNHEERTSTNNCMPGQVNPVFYSCMSQKASAKMFLCIFHPAVLSIFQLGNHNSKQKGRIKMWSSSAKVTNWEAWEVWFSKRHVLEQTDTWFNFYNPQLSQTLFMC